MTIILTSILAISVFWCLRGVIIQATQQKDLFPEPQRHFVVIAHRGASAHAPENTMPAFEQGVSAGADMTELDLHLSKDGEAVVIHDATLERTTNGNGLVIDKTWEELSQLDAGAWFNPSYSGTGVPSLKQVLEELNENAKLLIELKVDSKGKPYSGLVKRTVECIQEAQAEDRCILQAFCTDYLLEIDRLDIDIPYHKLIVDEYSPLPFYIDTSWKWGYLNDTLSWRAITPHFSSLTQGKIRERHMQGLNVFTYTVNDAATMRMLLNWGVDGIITNYPEIAVALKPEK